MSQVIDILKDNMTMIKNIDMKTYWDTLLQWFQVWICSIYYLLHLITSIPQIHDTWKKQFNDSIQNLNSTFCLIIKNKIENHQPYYTIITLSLFLVFFFLSKRERHYYFSNLPYFDFAVFSQIFTYSQQRAKGRTYKIMTKQFSLNLQLFFTMIKITPKSMRNTKQSKTIMIQGERETGRQRNMEI